MKLALALVLLAMFFAPHAVAGFFDDELDEYEQAVYTANRCDLVANDQCAKRTPACERGKHLRAPGETFDLLGGAVQACMNACPTFRTPDCLEEWSEVDRWKLECLKAGLGEERINAAAALGLRKAVEDDSENRR